MENKTDWRPIDCIIDEYYDVKQEENKISATVKKLGTQIKDAFGKMTPPTKTYTTSTGIVANVTCVESQKLNTDRLVALLQQDDSYQHAIDSGIIKLVPQVDYDRLEKLLYEDAVPQNIKDFIVDCTSTTTTQRLTVKKKG